MVANPPRHGGGDHAKHGGGPREVFPALSASNNPAPAPPPPFGRSPSPFRGGTELIIGLGSDLCNIERIQASLDRFGARFENRVFTEVERAKAARRPFTRAGPSAKRDRKSTRLNPDH